MEGKLAILATGCSIDNFHEPVAGLKNRVSRIDELVKNLGRGIGR